MFQWQSVVGEQTHTESSGESGPTKEKSMHNKKRSSMNTTSRQMCVRTRKSLCKMEQTWETRVRE